MYKKLVVEKCDTCQFVDCEITKRPCARCIDIYIMDGFEGVYYQEKRKEVTFYDRFVQWYSRLWEKFASC